MDKIKITYRATSRLRMSVGVNGCINISAPHGTAPEIIQSFIDKNKEWIARAETKIKRRRSQRDDFFRRLPLATNEEAREATRLMNAKISPLVRKYAAEMGVTPGVIRYRATRSRLGSCRKSTGEIMFSVYLLLFPDWIVEHVVVHELAHLIEPNHGPGFYRVMDRHFPRWREARDATRKILADSANN